MTKEQQELLDEANKKYPVGTEFKSAYYKSFHLIQWDKFMFIDNERYSMADECIIEVSSGGIIHLRGQWAEIMPNEPLIGGELNSQEVDVINLSAEIDRLKSEVSRLEEELKKQKESIVDKLVDKICDKVLKIIQDNYNEYKETKDDILEHALNNGIKSASEKYNLSTDEVRLIVMDFDKDNSEPCSCEKAKQKGNGMMCFICDKKSRIKI